MGDQIKANEFVIKAVCGKCNLQFNTAEIFIQYSEETIDGVVAVVHCPKCSADNILG